MMPPFLSVALIITCSTEQTAGASTNSTANGCALKRTAGLMADNRTRTGTNKATKHGSAFC
jgi:hypothetical protein